MAKAPAALPPNILTAKDATAQVVALINSRPVSPWPHEIEAIIAGVLARQDAPREDQTLAALEQKIRETDRLYGLAKTAEDRAAATPTADAADAELWELSKRIFAVQPITLHNLKLRATLAKYWHQHAPDGEQWEMPQDCGNWEDEVIAQLIHGVLRIDTPPDLPSFGSVTLPSHELATFRSALAGAAEFRRTNPEPEVAAPAYKAWYEQHGERLDGVWKIAESILAGKAPPLDVLSAIAVHYILDDHPELIPSAADGDAYDGMAAWIVARLLHAVQPSIQPKVGE